MDLEAIDLDDFKLLISLTRVSVQPVSALYTRISKAFDGRLVAAARENLTRFDDVLVTLAVETFWMDSSESESDTWADLADLVSPYFFI